MGTDPFGTVIFASVYTVEQIHFRSRLHWERIQSQDQPCFQHFDLILIKRNVQRNLPRPRSVPVRERFQPLTLEQTKRARFDQYSYGFVPAVYTGPKLEQIQTGTLWRAIPNQKGQQIRTGTDPSVPVQMKNLFVRVLVRIRLDPSQCKRGLTDNIHITTQILLPRMEMIENGNQFCLGQGLRLWSKRNLRPTLPRWPRQ